MILKKTLNGEVVFYKSQNKQIPLDSINDELLQRLREWILIRQYCKIEERNDKTRFF